MNYSVKLGTGIVSVLLAGQAIAHEQDHNHWQGWEAEPTSVAKTIVDFLIEPTFAEANISIEDGYRVIRSDGLPNHDTGRFPNRNNPNAIESQSNTYRVPVQPEYQSQTTALGMWPFGVALNGVVFDPGAAEFWQRDRNSGWQYEALGGAVNLGLDDSNAHVQPTGAYHYHGIPTELLEAYATEDGPVLLGYAADGFPIYGPYGYLSADNPNSQLVKLSASYGIKQGKRPDGPEGTYDGSFVEDYEYVAGSGVLDACNGREGVTPEYPQGTYHYVLTDQFPFIPRCFHGEPDRSFMRGHGGGQQAGQDRGERSERGAGMNREGQGREDRQPPAFAIEACKSKKEGDTVSLTTPRGNQLTATCRSRNGVLFAAPPRR